jgi:hypothetical protein
VYWDLVASSLRSKTELVLVHLPFSLLHAYLVFLLVLSAFTAFGVDKADHKAGPITQTLVIVALLLLASFVFSFLLFFFSDQLVIYPACVGSTGIGYTLHSDQGDIAGAIVIAIELVGVFARQTDPETIHWVALAAFLATVLAIVKVRPGTSCLLRSS